MKATASIDWDTNRNAEAVALPLTANFEEVAMRNTLVAVRDTLLVLGLQMVFRAMMVLRHLNY